MEITESKSGAVTTVALRGRVDSASAGPLRDRLSKLVESVPALLVLDFRDVAYISSAGFRTLLIIAKQSADAKGGLALSTLPLRATVVTAPDFDSVISMLPPFVLSARPRGRRCGFRRL